MGRYPQETLNDIEPGEVSEIVTSIKELHDLGRPTTDDEVESRINEYFALCQRSGLRPGIESLCLSLHITRTTLFNWSHGEKCSERRQELAQSAKAFIAAYLEQAVMRGKISPPSGIFLMKNWLNYKDTISLDESVGNKIATHLLTASELPRLGVSLPDLSKKDEQ